MNQAQRVNCWTAALSRETQGKERTRMQTNERRDAFDLYQNGYSPSFTLQKQLSPQKGKPWPLWSYPLYVNINIMPTNPQLDG